MTAPAPVDPLHDERPTILIVDDVPGNLQVLGELLQPEFRVRAANSGAAALRIAASLPAPDVILLDIMMPEMDGYEVLTHLREDPATRDIPVIFLTALDTEQDEKRGFDLGAVDFIAKPLRPSVVMARVRNHVELKRARDILSRRNVTLAKQRDLLFNYSLDILCIADFNGYFKELNPAFSRILGWCAKDAQKCPWLEFVHPDDAEAAALGQKALTLGQPLAALEIRFRHQSGHYRWLSWNAVPVLEERASFCVARDITEQYHAKQQLNAYSEQMSWLVEEEIAKNRKKDVLLMQQSRLATMGELIHNIAHHWRQPINALGIILSNLKDAYEYGELTPEYLDDEVAKGNRLVQQMSGTIDEFRNFFKPNKEKSAFNLKEIVDDTLALLSASFRNLNIAVSLEADEDITAYGYPNEYSQVLVNLLNNAREVLVTRKIAGPTIHLRITRSETEALLLVRDNAGGIPEDILEKVFDPYFTTKDGGTGLGLYMARIIANHMDGRVEAGNTEGGAVFLLAVPLQT